MRVCLVLALVLWLGQTKAEEVVEDDMVIVEGMAQYQYPCLGPLGPNLASKANLAQIVHMAKKVHLFVIRLYDISTYFLFSTKNFSLSYLRC